MNRILLIIFLLFASGCTRGINYTKILTSQILSDQPQVIYVQVLAEDDYESDMSSVVEKTKMIEHVKDVKYISTDEADYMTFWIPITFGSYGENTKTLSIYRGVSSSGSGIGWEINNEWAERFPKTFMSNGVLVELCNDTTEEFVSLPSRSVTFDGRPSSFLKASLSHGKCMKSAIFLTINSPFMQRDAGVRKLDLFLLDAAKAK